MKKLINVDTGEVLTLSDEDKQFGGEWGRLQNEKKAVFVDVPDGEHPDDCDVVLGPIPILTVNAQKKADRLAVKKDDDDRIILIKSVKSASSVDELKEVLIALIEHMFGEIK